MIELFRDAPWLTAERARRWCVVLAAVCGLAVVVWLGLSHDGRDQAGRVIGYDFTSFWAGAHVALDGHPALPYDQSAYDAAQATLFPGASNVPYRYPYPPPFLLLTLPLGALPYLPALLSWLALGFAGFVVCIRRLLPERWAILPIVAFPAVLVTGVQGHGFLSVICFALATLLLERRPFGAGLALGLLAYKPHLLLAAPIALLVARRWRALAGLAVASITLGVASFFVLGRDVWIGFLHSAPTSRAIVERQDPGEEAKMQSVFAAVRLLHGSVALAYALHAAVAALAVFVLVKAAARRRGGPAEGALIVAATFLVPPYTREYDLVCLAVPMAWVMNEAQKTDFFPWEKVVLLCAYTVALLAPVLARTTYVPSAPVVLFALLVIVARRQVVGSGGPRDARGSDEIGDCPRTP